MVVGFNHNFRYKGEIYHIQTEDGGLKSPNIVTLLYRGGTILASKKTSYADITKIDNLEQVVEELMKEQHKNMLRSLKSAEFDDIITRFEAGRGGQPQPAVTPEKPAAAPAPPVVAPPAASPSPPRPVASSAQPQPTAAPKIVPPPAAPSRPAAAVPPVAPDKPQSPSPKTPPTPTVETSLDEIILSYLIGEEK